MANEMMSGSEKAIVPDRDVKPLMEELDGLLAEAGVPAAEGETVEVEEEVEETVEAPEGEEAAEDSEAQTLADALGIELAQAEMLMQAAQMMEATRGKSADELAKMLAEDFHVRVGLVILAGGQMDQMEMEAAAPMADTPAAGPQM